MSATGPLTVLHRNAADEIVYREAFATLEQARRGVLARLPENADEQVIAVVELPDSGGTLTLPNGDVIEVEATTIVALYDAIGQAYLQLPHPWTADAACAAWNAEHGIGLGVRA